MRQKYQLEVTGLLFNTTSFMVFGLKVLLLMVECQRSLFWKHITQLTFIPSVRGIVMKIASQRSSHIHAIIQPLSQFLFCTTAIIFAFLHPSALFVPFIPVLILGFFSNSREHQSCCNLLSLSSSLTAMVI